MRRIGFLALGFAVLALIAGVVPKSFGTQITFEQRPTEVAAPQPEQAQAPACLPVVTTGPYVQNVTATGAVIMWQSDVPSFGEIRITGPGANERYRTEHAVTLGEVRVNGLQLNTVYDYVLMLSSSPKTAVSGSFRTFPTKPGPIRFLVYGDTRTHPARHAEAIRAMARERNVLFALHTGDVVSDGRKLEVWKPEFFDPARDLIRRVPVYPVLGNHERNSRNYFDLFSLPGNERWYSFDLPNVHIIALDSNLDFDEGSEQYKWLIDDLIAHINVRWKFVFLHHPVYTSGNHGAVDELGVPKEKPTAVARRLLPQLAETYGIKAVFSGHDHDYERSTRNGIYYIVTGGGGAPTYTDVYASANPYRNVFRGQIHYCVVTLDGNFGQIIAKTPGGETLDKAQLIGTAIR